MPLVLADRVRDTTTTTGTGTITLSGTAPTGYQNFAVIGNGNTCYYTINGGSQWEVGIGTYSSTGPTLARTTILASSNSGAVVSLAAGTKDVFVTYPAGKSVNQDAAGNVGIGTSSPTAKLDVNGDIRMGAELRTGTGVSTGTTSIELGGGRTGDGFSFIDFHSTSGTDFETRMIRDPGANGDFSINNLGTGTFVLNAAGNAPMAMKTFGTERMRINNAGLVQVNTTSTPTYGLPKLVVDGGISGKGTVTVNNSTATTIAEGAGLLLLIRNSTHGGTAVVQYENATTPIIIATSGGTTFQTGTPSGSAQIQLTNRSGNLGVAALASGDRNGASLSVTVLQVFE